MKTLPMEGHYPGLSLNYDLGYGAEGEYNIVKSILEAEGFPTTDSSIIRALEFSRDAYVFLSVHCQTELKSYQEIGKRDFIVGCDIVAGIGIAHLLLASALAAVKTGKTLWEMARNKSENDKIVDSIIKKFENHNDGKVIARKTTEFTLESRKKVSKRNSTTNKKSQKKDVKKKAARKKKPLFLN